MYMGKYIPAICFIYGCIYLAITYLPICMCSYEGLLFGEYGPIVEYIKGVDNIVTDAIGRLEYNPKKKSISLGVHQCYCHMAMLFNHYMYKHGRDDTDTYHS